MQGKRKTEKFSGFLNVGFQDIADHIVVDDSAEFKAEIGDYRSQTKGEDENCFKDIGVAAEGEKCKKDTGQHNSGAEQKTGVTGNRDVR